MKQYKNKFHQRVLALALALMLCLGMLPLKALAGDAPEAPEAEPGIQETELTVGDVLALAGDEDSAPAEEEGSTVTTDEDAIGMEDSEKLESLATPVPENTPTPAPLTDEELAGVERPGQSGTVGVKPGEGFATPAPGEDNPENQEVNADVRSHSFSGAGSVRHSRGFRAPSGDRGPRCHPRRDHRVYH